MQTQKATETQKNMFEQNTLQNDIPNIKQLSKHTDPTATIYSSVIILLFQTLQTNYLVRTNNIYQNILSYILNLFVDWTIKLDTHP